MCVYVRTYISVLMQLLCVNMYTYASLLAYILITCVRVCVCVCAAELVLKYKYGFVASLRNVVSLWFVLA